MLGKRKKGRSSTGVGGEGEKEMVKMIKIYCTLAQKLPKNINSLGLFFI